jgi:hypothetical protein
VQATVAMVVPSTPPLRLIIYVTELFLCEFSMSSNLAFRVRAFGCTIDVASEGRELHALLDRYVLPPLPRVEVGPDRPDIFIHAGQAGERFELSVNDEAVASASQPLDLAPKLINLIDEAVIQRLTKLYAVHAGAVLLAGRGLLLPGGTHAGKSSLVVELLRRGARYLSDEYALIDPQGRVHSYPRPLLLRNGRPKQSAVLPEDCNSSTADAPAPVGWILSLEYQSARSWSVAKVSQSLAMLSLLQNTPHALADSPEMVSSFQRAVAGAVCYAGQRAEAVDAVDHILRLVDADQAS